jgi:hypothetical protein
MPTSTASTTSSFSLNFLGRRPKDNFITLDSTHTPVWLNNQPLQIPIRDFSIINIIMPEESSIEVGYFHYDPSDSQGLIKASSVFNNSGTAIFDTIEEDTMDEDETEDDIDGNEVDEDEDDDEEEDDDEFGYDDDNFDDDGFDFNDSEDKNDDRMDDEDGRHSRRSIIELVLHWLII